MKLSKKAGWLIAVLLVVLMLVYNQYPHNDKRTETVIKILNDNIRLPADFDYWKYDPKTQWLRFTLDVQNFSTVKAEFSDANTRDIDVELRPLNSEWGEKYFWGKEDPIHKSRSYNCKKFKRSEIKYEFCDHGAEPALISAGDTFYSIRNIKTNEYITMIGCTMYSAHINSICNGRAKLPGGLQLEYVYRRENFSKAIDIDSHLRSLVDNLVQQEEKNYEP